MSESQSTPEIIVASTPSTIRKKRRSETDILVAEQYAQEEDHRLSQTLSEIAENEDRSEERRREAERRLNRYDFINSGYLLTVTGGIMFLTGSFLLPASMTLYRDFLTRGSGMWSRKPYSEWTRLQTCCPRLFCKWINSTELTRCAAF